MIWGIPIFGNTHILHQNPRHPNFTSSEMVVFGVVLGSKYRTSTGGTGCLGKGHSIDSLPMQFGKVCRVPGVDYGEDGTFRIGAMVVLNCYPEMGTHGTGIFS